MRVLLSTIFMLFSLQIFAIWIPFGPEGIEANSVAFGIHNAYPFTVCHNEGISLYEPVSQDWVTYESDLPVMDAAYLDGIKILVILGGGSNSDGIYAFDPATSLFELIEWIDTPHFIYYAEDQQDYYIGHRFGMMTSEDGLNWTGIDALKNCNIVAMDSYQDHYAVARLDNLYGVWYSHDEGITWNAPTPGSPAISCLAFDHYGILYGIFPDESYSSGLWSSVDHGETWEVEFWSVNMSCVAIDVMNGVYIGWDENLTGTDEGIAFYDPASGHINFINEGLASLVINDISINLKMSAIALFCCTDSGAYTNYDYIGISEKVIPGHRATLSVYPNPSHAYVNVDYQLPGYKPNSRLLIYHADGRQVYSHLLNQAPGHLNIDVSSLSPGVYYFQLKENKHYTCQKVLIY